jgi:hypothetical protein
MTQQPPRTAKEIASKVSPDVGEQRSPGAWPRGRGHAGMTARPPQPFSRKMTRPPHSRLPDPVIRTAVRMPDGMRSALVNANADSASIASRRLNLLNHQGNGLAA